MLGGRATVSVNCPGARELPPELITMIVYGPLLLPAAGKMVILPLVQLTIVASRDPNSTRPPLGTI